MAYGRNAPFGVRAVYNNTGSTWVERRTAYQIPDSGGDNPVGYGVSIFQNDLVRLATTGNASAAGGVNTINLYTPTFTSVAGNGPSTFTGDATLPVLGLFLGCEYYDVTNQLQRSPFWPAGTLIFPGTTITAFVNDDPNVVCEVQVSTPVNGLNADFAGGSTAATTAAPFFPGNASATTSVGIGSNFTIYGGGGKNFDTIPIDPTNPTGEKYTNNPASTMTTLAVGQPIVTFGTNPFGGNIKSGISGAYLCVSTYGTNATDTFTGNGAYNVASNYDHTAATLPLKVIGFSPKNVNRPGKTILKTPFVTVLVTINNHVFKPGTSGPTFT